MEDSRKAILDLASGSLRELIKEFDEYFNMIKQIIYDPNVKKELDIPKKEILEKFFLSEEKLQDPLNIPEILLLAEYMKENNYQFFPRNWNTYGYYHYDHGLRLKDLIEELRPIAKKIKKFRLDKLEKLLSTTLNESFEIPVEPVKIFIEINFNTYGLPEFDEFKDLINKAAYNPDFYRILPFLLRNLFENLLYYIFRDGLEKKYTPFYFLTSQYRPRDFAQLIILLRLLLKSEDFKKYTKEAINEYTMENLKDMKKFGNWTVHEILKQVDSDFADKWIEKVNRLLSILLTLYKNIKENRIENLDEKLVEKIKEKFNIKE